MCLRTWYLVVEAWFRWKFYFSGVFEIDDELSSIVSSVLCLIALISLTNGMDKRFVLLEGKDCHLKSLCANIFKSSQNVKIFAKFREISQDIDTWEKQS